MSHPHRESMVAVVDCEAHVFTLDVDSGSVAFPTAAAGYSEVAVADEVGGGGNEMCKGGTIASLPIATVSQPTTISASAAAAATSNGSGYGRPIRYSEEPGFTMVRIDEFSSDLFSLHDNVFPSCLCALLCPCFLASQLSQRLGLCKFWWTFGSFCVLLFFLIIAAQVLQGDVFLLLWLFFFYLSWSLRDRLRSSFNLVGDPFSDCCASMLCSLCSLAQTARHLNAYRGSCDLAFTLNTDGTPTWHNELVTSLVAQHEVVRVQPIYIV